MTKIVQSKRFHDAQYVGMFRRGRKEYVRVKWSSRQVGNRYGCMFYYKDLPAKDVIRIVRAKSAVERWAIKLFRKIYKA